MIRLFTDEEFSNAKSNDLLLCQCEQCNESFTTQKKYVVLALKHHVSKHVNYSGSCKYCSKKCQFESQKTSRIVVCSNCGKSVLRMKSAICNNSFCSKSCSAIYNNTHKKHGGRVSKLEKYIQQKLTDFFPDLDIHYNRKDAINSELDIYIPSLNLAFELNGIFHYEPIFGKDKLSQVQNNDDRKFQACLEREISLCIIDASKLTYNTVKNMNIYLEIILNIVLSCST